jgi:hypothetical protein
MKGTVEERFWAKVEKTDGCWPWKGSCGEAGHGQLWVNGRLVQASRVSWELHNGPIPDGLCALHRCDNPPCVRPDHLFLGTKADNSKDMRMKGRSRGASHKGSSNPSSKLDEAQAATIRATVEAGEAKRSVARRFGVSQRTVQRIVSGTHWRSAGGATA